MIILQAQHGGSFFGMTVISALILVPAIIQIYWLYSSLKKEKEGYLQLTEAAQELNNRKLHEAGAKLFQSNKLKYSILYFAVIQSLIALVIVILALKN